MPAVVDKALACCANPGSVLAAIGDTLTLGVDETVPIEEIDMVRNTC
jgi:hypothetical protein